jgi:hypothetical protein
MSDDPTARPTGSDNDGAKMSFFDHLTELRRARPC